MEKQNVVPEITDGNKKDKVLLKLVENKDGKTFLNYFNKDDLVKCIFTTYKYLKNNKVEYTPDSDNKIIWIMNRFLAKKPNELLKDELSSLIASLGYNLYNLKQLLLLDNKKRFLNLWKEVLLNPEVNLSKAKEILGYPLEIMATGGWNVRYLSDLLILPVSLSADDSYYSRYSYYNSYKPTVLLVSQSIRKFAIEIFFGESYITPKIKKEIDDNLIIENFEKYIYEDCEYMAGVKSCNSLTSSSGTLTAARIKSISSKLSSPDFASYKLQYPVLRKSMLILAFKESAEYTKNKVDVKYLAKDFVSNFGRHLLSGDFSIMLPKYKGFTKNYTEGSRAFYISQLINKLIAPAADGWMSMEYFSVIYLCNDNIINGHSAYTFLFNINDYSRYASLRLESQSAFEKAPNISLWYDLTLPYIVHYIKLLCALGLIEIAVDPKEVDDTMEGIKYIRMTRLGRYAFGIDKDYKCIMESQADQFELDKDNPIVTVLNPQSPYIMFLEQFGKRIGANRFHISASEMIRKASGKEQVRLWVENFINIVCPEPTGIWKKIIDEIEERINIRLSAGSAFSIVQLDTKIPGLVEFISNDKEIRENSIFAQRGYMLVYTSYMVNFQKKLKAAGYIF